MNFCFGSRASHKSREGARGLVSSDSWNGRFGLTPLPPKQKALAFKCLVVQCLKLVPVKRLRIYPAQKINYA